ncbi:MAG TPA: DNA internalization-related competence protein ComEC/Rec2, partial [Gemmatimonadaceae bacterium]|nr:DNA internalization-related competence protein ComEC/Rec2 [Gemmatimonadaceae bacterium]
GAPVGLIATIVTIGCALAGQARRATVASMVVAGCISATSARDARHRCIADSARRATVRVRVAADVAPGGFSTGTLACGGSATLFVVSGRAPAGAVVVVSGASATSSDTMRMTVRAARLEVIEEAPWAPRLRTAAARTTDRDFTTDAPLVRALVLADMRVMAPEIRDRWAAAGMVHMLSVSGLHVGIIAAVVELLLGVLHVHRRSAPAGALAIIAIYVVIIGAPAPAVRSALMLAVRALGRMAQRPVSAWAILALGAGHPLIDPWVVLDLGYQLSVIGVAALIAAGHLVRRIPLDRRPKWARAIVSGAVTTVVATIASMPLVAWSMGRVSLIAPLSNLAAGPFIAAVQPMLFLGVLLSPVPVAAKWVADAAHPLLVALNAIASASAAIPGASVSVWPTTPAALLAGIAAIGVLVACVQKHPARPMAIALCAVVLLAWVPAPRGGDMTELHMIDVGQGDAIALRTKAGRWVLFDAGRTWEGGDAGRRTVIPYIAHRGGTLEAFVLSHPHADHVGGAASVLDALAPPRYVDAAFVTNNEAYRASLLTARARQVQWTRARPGDSLVVDEATIVFLAPDSAFAVALPDPNNASTVALIRVGEVRMLMMGDAEREEEAWLLDNARDWLAADVLKVGHHGSSTSSTASFLDAVRPRIALVSVGAGNTYGHPSKDVMTSLTRRGAQVVRTDRAGTVVVETDGRTVRVRPD